MPIVYNQYKITYLTLLTNYSTLHVTVNITYLCTLPAAAIICLSGVISKAFTCYDLSRIQSYMYN